MLGYPLRYPLLRSRLQPQQQPQQDRTLEHPSQRAVLRMPHPQAKITHCRLMMISSPQLERSENVACLMDSSTQPPRCRESNSKPCPIRTHTPPQAPRLWLTMNFSKYWTGSLIACPPLSDRNWTQVFPSSLKWQIWPTPQSLNPPM